jgi:hypothetical protein
MKPLRQDAVGPPSQSIPLAIIESEVFSSDPDVRRGVHEYMGTSQVGTVATHPGSAHPPSHCLTLYPHAARTSSICALPTVQRHRDGSCECVRSRGRGQPRPVLYQWSVLSPRAEALGCTACACLLNHMPGTILILEFGNPADFRDADRPKHSATVVLIAWHPHPRSNRPSSLELLPSSFATARAVYC